MVGWDHHRSRPLEPDRRNLPLSLVETIYTRSIVQIHLPASGRIPMARSLFRSTGLITSSPNLSDAGSDSELPDPGCMRKSPSSERTETLHVDPARGYQIRKDFGRWPAILSVSWTVYSRIWYVLNQDCLAFDHQVDFHRPERGYRTVRVVSARQNAIFGGCGCRLSLAEVGHSVGRFEDHSSPLLRSYHRSLNHRLQLLLLPKARAYPHCLVELTRNSRHCVGKNHSTQTDCTDPNHTAPPGVVKLTIQTK
jgi:hypothetical protein